MKIEYAIIIKSKTRLELLTDRFNTKAQAKFYIESLGGDFNDYVLEHENFHTSINKVQKQLSNVIKNKIVERPYISSFLFAPNHLILVVGQDGLVANTAKYANNVPIIGINPDKQRYDGVLLPFNSENFIAGVDEVISGGAYKFRMASMAEAKLNDGQRLLAFNDLFIGASSHVSARYKINFHNKSESHSSSGIIVSTKSGATGWLSSIFNMANGIQASVNKGKATRKYPVLDDNKLVFAVREPFASVTTQTDICIGTITKTMSLQVESLMPTNGVIFSDGIESDFVSFNSGSIATIGIAQETAKLVEL